MLERAAAGNPGDAATLSDLAAAYLARAQALDQPVDWIAALDAAERAAELSPESREAFFNRALARQKLALADQAARAWREYLHRERDPAWRREAESALARLTAPPPAALWPAVRQQLQQQPGT